AVEERRHPASGDVILRDIRGAGHPADAGIQPDGRQQEPVADPGARHPHLLGQRERKKEGDEAAGIEGVVLLELAVEVRLREGRGAHSRSPSSTPYSLSSLRMISA